MATTSGILVRTSWQTPPHELANSSARVGKLVRTSSPSRPHELGKSSARVHQVVRTSSPNHAGILPFAVIASAYVERTPLLSRREGAAFIPSQPFHSTLKPANLRFITAIASGLESTSIASLPSAAALSPRVPDPAKKSISKSPGFEWTFTILSMMPRGFWVA